MPPLGEGLFLHDTLHPSQLLTAFCQHGVIDLPRRVQTGQEGRLLAGDTGSGISVTKDGVLARPIIARL